MAEHTILAALRHGLWLLTLCAAPPLCAAALTSLILQLVSERLRHGPALTLPCTLAGGLALLACAPWIGREFVRFTTALLTSLPALGG